MASVAEPLESFKKAKKTNITLVICKVSSIYEVKYDPKTIVINNYLPTYGKIFRAKNKPPVRTLFGLSGDRSFREENFYF